MNRIKALLLSTVGVAAAVSAGPVFAEAATTDQTAANTVQEVVVLGTRRTDRTLENSASPVDVIGGAELKSQPAANLLDSLKNIVPSFYVGQNSISDASTFVRAPSLRGLPADEILVMLNGKRYNRSALVQVYGGGDTALSFGSQGADISAIPSIGIKNLQVLRDGATAQYGSDAIAGVLNYGLRDNASGVELVARYGQYFDNSDGVSKQIAGNAGFALGDKGFINVSAEYNDDEQTSRGATRPIAVQFAAANPTLASKLPNYPDPVQIWGNSPSRGYKLLLNSAYDITPDSKIYLFANYAKIKANESFNYRSPISGTAVDAAGVTHNLGANGAFRNTFYLTPCPTGNATCPAGGFVKDTNTFLFSSIYPAGFTPRFVGETEEKYVTVGYKGKFKSGLTYDVSASTSENTLDLSMYSSISPSYGEKSQTSFKFGKLSQKETDFNIDLSYPVNVNGLFGPVVLSGGAEYRHEEYGQTAGDPQSYGAGPYAVKQNLYSLVSPGVYTAAGTSDRALSPGASGYGGTSPEAAGTWDQNNWGVYIDAEADITEKLSVGLAARYEDYSTFGGTTVGKLNALYKVFDGFSIRGTIGTGYHAPSPGQSNDEILTTTFVAGNQVQVGTYPVGSTIAKYYGATTLKPEESTNYGFGFVAKPMTNTLITVDAYVIDVTSRLGISTTHNVTAADVAAQPALNAVGVGGAVTFFTNAFDTQTRGLDIVATHRVDDLFGGRANLTLAYNYNTSEVTKRDPLVITDDQVIDIKHLAPNHRVVASINWTRGPWTLNARENYYGTWRDENDYPGQLFGAKTTTDIDVSYALADRYTITLGATNVFNTYPDKIAQSSSNAVYPVTGSLDNGSIYPRNGGPFGFNGGFWYVRLQGKF